MSFRAGLASRHKLAADDTNGMWKVICRFQVGTIEATEKLLLSETSKSRSAGGCVKGDVNVAGKVQQRKRSG